MSDDKTLNKLLPLSPGPLHIVLALNRGPRHGYAIMSDVEELSAGAIKMGPGTLYGSIKKLLASGVIEQVADDSGTDERRKYYRLTALGQNVCDAELERLETLVQRSRSGAPVRLLGGGA